MPLPPPVAVAREAEGIRQRRAADIAAAAEQQQAVGARRCRRIHPIACKGRWGVGFAREQPLEKQKMSGMQGKLQHPNAAGLTSAVAAGRSLQTLEASRSQLPGSYPAAA
jgi:hypothetical protein